MAVQFRPTSVVPAFVRPLLAVSVGVASRPRMVKSVSDTSKNTLPTACTMTRARVLAGKFSGSTTLSVPSLGVAAASVTEYVKPPSKESRISTRAAAMGAAVVPATSQLTARAAPACPGPAPAAGSRTTNGPAVASTARLVES